MSDHDQDSTSAPSGDLSAGDPPPPTGSPGGAPAPGPPETADHRPTWPAGGGSEAGGWAQPGHDQVVPPWPPPAPRQPGAPWGSAVQQGQPAWAPPAPPGAWAPPGSPAPGWPQGQPGWGQQQPWGTGWAAGGQAPGASNGVATAGLVLGVVSIVLFWTFGFGVLLGLLAVVLGAIGMRRADQLPGRLNRGQGLAGVITGVAGIVLGVAFVLLVVVAADEVGVEMNSDPPDGSCDEERFFQDPDC